jgi:hypothetical protein
MISRPTLVVTTLALAAFLAACDSSITQPGLERAGSVAFAKGGNSEAAKACQGGGFQTMEGADGAAFTNAGECVSYAAKGGVLRPNGPKIIEIDSRGIDCTVQPWTVTVVMIFSGGTGTVNGYPLTSGVDLTIPQTADRLYEFVVTNGTQSVTEVRSFACT